MAASTPAVSHALHPDEQFVAQYCRALLSRLDQKRLKRDSFRNVPDLIAAITDYVDNHNDDPRPIVWTATAEKILDKVGRARLALDNRGTA